LSIFSQTLYSIQGSDTQQKLQKIQGVVTLKKISKNPKKIPVHLNIIFQNPSEILVLNGY
jgi:hypothetical protein